MRTAEELMNAVLDYEADAKAIKKKHGAKDPKFKEYSNIAENLREELKDRFGIINF